MHSIYLPSPRGFGKLSLTPALMEGALTRYNGLVHIVHTVHREYKPGHRQNELLPASTVQHEAWMCACTLPAQYCQKGSTKSGEVGSLDSRGCQEYLPTLECMVHPRAILIQ